MVIIKDNYLQYDPKIDFYNLSGYAIVKETLHKNMIRNSVCVTQEIAVALSVSVFLNENLYLYSKVVVLHNICRKIYQGIVNK